MLQKLLQLAKDEGGKAFVMNEITGEVFCVMPLEVYQLLKTSTSKVDKTASDPVAEIGSLSEEELLRKINREIAIWRDNQKDKAEIILPAHEDRNSVPEIKSKIAKDFPKVENISSLQSAPIVKAPILETEEEFFLEMA